MTETQTPFGPVSGADMAEWSGYFNDDNAIHLDRDAAMAAGFGPRRVNPGPANLAYALSAAMAADPQAEFAEITAHFAANVLEDDQLVIHLSADAQGGTAELHAKGRAAAVLDARFAFKARPTAKEPV